MCSTCNYFILSRTLFAERYCLCKVKWDIFRLLCIARCFVVFFSSAATIMCTYVAIIIRDIGFIHRRAILMIFYCILSSILRHVAHFFVGGFFFVIRTPVTWLPYKVGFRIIATRYQYWLPRLSKNAWLYSIQEGYSLHCLIIIIIFLWNKLLFYFRQIFAQKKK